MLHPTDQTRITRRREVLFAAVGLALVTVCLIPDLAAHPGSLLTGVHSSGRNDLTSHFLRSRDVPAVLRDRFKEWSFWDPYLALGFPVHGNPQSALLYPPNWIVWLAGAQSSLSWLMVAHLWFGATGVWMFVRHAGCSRGAALIGSVAAAGAPYLIAHLAEGHVPQLCTVAWIPWILLGHERFLESAGRRWRMIPVCVALSFLAGHVQELYYLMLLLTGSVLGAAMTEKRRGQPTVARSLVLHWGLAGLCSVALVCAELIPVWLNSQLTVRSERLPLVVAGDGLTRAHWKQLLDPFALGTPHDTASSHGFYWTKLFHFGVIPLLLCVLAVLTQWKRPQTPRLFWMLAIAVVFAFGAATPLFTVAYRCVPVLGSFRVPTRILFLCSYFVAALAAFGADLLFGRSAQAGTDGNPVDRNDASAWPVRLKELVLLGVAIGLAAGVGWELRRHAVRVVALVQPDGLRRGSSISRFLTEIAEGDSGNLFRVLASQELYSDVESFRDGVQRVRGYEPVPQIRLAWAIDALFDLPDGQLDFAGFRDVDLASVHPSIANLLGVKYVVTGASPSSSDHWRLVDSGRVPPPVRLLGAESASDLPYRVYENPDALPRAFVVGQAVECDGMEIQERIEQLEKLDIRQSVQLERDVLPPGARSEFTAGRIVEYRADQVTVSVEIDAPGYLIVTDLFHPGWQATVDDDPVRILAGNLACRVVPLPAGKHVVKFQFECPGQKTGAAVSLMAIAGLLISSWRSRSAESSPPRQNH